MTSSQPSQLMTLSRRKAVLTRLYGKDDERTLAAAAELRRALLKRAIDEAVRTRPPLTDSERAELAGLLLSA